MYFIVLMLVLLGVKFFVNGDKNSSVRSFSDEKKVVELISKKAEIGNVVKNLSQDVFEIKEADYVKSKLVVSSFFNPNDLVLSEWMLFGMSEKQATSLMKYISSKGGLVHPKELLDIYVLSKRDKETLVKWCRIEKGKINDWSQADFQKISGIGKVLSKRIVKYRDLLGGFYSLDQLREVYGLDSLIVDNIKRRAAVTRVDPLEINKLSYRVLLSHPYIGKAEAKLIVRERTIRLFSEESHLFEVFSEEYKIKRLKPYVSYE
jgi:competence protein ComEA